MSTGGGDEIVAVLEKHGSFASLELVAEARTFKNTIRNQLKKKRLKANKAKLEQISAQKAASLETAEKEFVALALSHDGACAEPDMSSGSMAVEPPHGSVCPITDELMLDPVICSDGQLLCNCS